MKQTIKKLLRENTGMHLLDSGQKNGRNWQQNQKRQFENEARFFIDEYDISRNIYFYLLEHLSKTDKSQKFQRMYNRVNKGSEESYLYDIETFIDYLDKHNYLESDNYLIQGKSHVVNTYNYENCLSQILQYAVFYNGGTYFIVLQVHGGCDARGGYTKPKIFELEDYERFVLEQSSFTVETVKNEVYYTDDCYNFYLDGQCDDKITKTYDELYNIGILNAY